MLRRWARSRGSAALLAGCTCLAATATVAWADDGAKAKFKDFFDAEAYERAANALKDIEKSPHAKQVLDLTKQQEVTKQQELAAEAAKATAAAAAKQVELERVRAEETRLTNRELAQQRVETAKYQDELNRQRDRHNLEMQKQQQMELLRLKEESNRKMEMDKLRIAQQIEDERRKSEKFRADKEADIARAKATAEAEGRIKERRENEDVNRRELVLKLNEQRRLVVESIRELGATVGSGGQNLLGDPQRLARGVAAFGGAALLFFVTREGVRVSGRLAEMYLGQPSLVRETSRRRPLAFLSAARGNTSSVLVTDTERGFRDVILEERLKDHVRKTAAVTANTRQHGAPFRHMLFYGPPGTGKTLAAKKLARTSGLDYAIMSGGDVAPLGPAAVTQLHKLFDWAETSRRGLLLFIDEADAFLGRRHQGQSEALRGALNAMLFRTGDQSRDFVVVLATNRPSDLDAAVLDRMDEAIEFPLPGPRERKELLKLYVSKYITSPETDEDAQRNAGFWRSLARGRKLSPDRIQVKGLAEEHFDAAAAKTEDMSAREIAKLVAAVQAACYGSHDTTLTPDVFLAVVDRKVAEHRRRREIEKTSVTFA